VRLAATPGNNTEYLEMWDDIAGAYGGRFFLAAGGVGLALLVLIGILWIVRNRAPSPFVRGGRNRQPRLQVLDAAAVDARRRLVLVRRDGVEHLIMIGGPTDIVIESCIVEPSKAGISTAGRPVDIDAATTAELAPPPPRPALERLEPARTIEPAISAEPALPPVPAPAVAQQQRAVRQPALPSQQAEAAVVLEAARPHVMPPESSRSVAQADRRAVDRQEAAPSIAPPPRRELGSDFEQVLEAEMSSNLTAERIIPNAPVPRAAPQPAPAPAQRRDPELAPMTGSDSALQKEVARIFGEMSVGRDK
jgi:hypothetical protein